MPSPLERLAIRSVRVVDPSQALDAVMDLVIENGHIRACGPHAADSLPSDFPQLDGTQWVAMPGLTDLRARLGEPGFEFKEDLRSGLHAAAAGGFSYVCGLPTTRPVHDDAVVTHALLAGAARLGRAQYLPIAAATLGLHGEQLTNIGELQAAGAVAVSDADSSIRSANVMRRLLQYAGGFGMLVMQHPREASLTEKAVFHEGAVSSRLGLVGWPRAAETIGLCRDLELAESTGSRLHVSCVSAAASLRHLRLAKQRGVAVTADVAVHHLLLDETDAPDFDVRYRVEPPLREPADRNALIEALADGTLDCVVSDHRPQTSLDTNCEFPEAEPGFVGLELTLSGVWSLVREGRISALRAVELLGTRPAQVLGRSPSMLRVGQAATFTLFAPETSWVPARGPWRSKCTNTPLFHRELTGRVALTVLDGTVIFQSEELT